MNNFDYKSLSVFPIFNNMNEDGIKKVLNCLVSEKRDYKRGDIIYEQLYGIEYAGIVLSGTVKASIFSLCGREHNLRVYEVGDLFAESVACVPESKTPIQISAQSDCKILFVKLANLMQKRAVNCPYASQATVNLLKIIASNNIFHIKKEHIINQKKIRDKLIMFLQNCKSDNNHIVLPYNRQELADYLGVERSALSREMSKMKDEGLIVYYKNNIILNNK